MRMYVSLHNKFNSLPLKVKTGIKHSAITGVAIAATAFAVSNIVKDLNATRNELSADTIELSDNGIFEEDVIRIEKPEKKNLLAPIIILSAAVLSAFVSTRSNEKNSN